MKSNDTDHRPASPGSLDRRGFIKVGALAGGGLLVGAWVPFGDAAAAAQTNPAAPRGFTPNVFVSIAPNSAVKLVAPNSEMGQGAKTALPMIVAEELDLPWDRVTVVQGDLNPAYGRQAAVGSGSTPGNYGSLRHAGAAARALLVEAAAQTWGVPARECSTAGGAVLHEATRRRLAYGELAGRAATLPAPPDVALKDPKDFKLLGTRVPGVDNGKIVTGRRLFGIDQSFPGMAYAAYVKCPVFGGRVADADLADAKGLPGVRDVFVIEGIPGLPSGVAVVADSTWTAFKAAEKVRVRWDEGPGAGQDSAAMAKRAAELGTAEPAPPVPEGATGIDAVYHYPFLAHATLEPQNCTALFKGGVMEMWCPTQMPSSGQRLVSRGLGLAPGDIVVHVTRMGGGFGRRGSNEFSLEAAAIARKLEGTPVKLTWTREQDFAHDNYRSNGWHFLRGALDRDGRIVLLHDSFVKIEGGPGDMTAGKFPFIAVAGSQVRSSKISGTVPTGYWRSPGDNGNAWATQSFVDELAHAAGRDPLEFTLGLLSSVPEGRQGGFVASKMATVLKLAAEKSGWGAKLPRGQGRGLAISHTNNTYVAVVAEVAVAPEGELRIRKLVAAVDAGLIVNLSSAESQVQGAMLDGIGAAWFLKVTIGKGAAVQANFNDYRLARMEHTPPVVDVHFIGSDAPPNGLGEPGLPPAAPAVCNAIFAATGKRIRTLPIVDGDLKWE